MARERGVSGEGLVACKGERMWEMNMRKTKPYVYGEKKNI